MYHGTLGYSGGIAFQHNWGKGIALRTNIAYERKGGEGEFEFTDKYGASIGKGIVNLNFDYLTIPVLLRFTFGKRVKYFINGGSYIGYLIKQTFVFKGTNIDYESNNTASYNSLDAGISLGTGLQYPMNEKWFLSSEIRGNMGLFSTTPFGDTKVNSVNLLLGIAYRL